MSTTVETMPPALPLTAEFVNEVAALMKVGDISRRQLAGRLGIEPGQVSNILSGNPDLLTEQALTKIAQALNATWIISLVPNGDPDAYPGTA